MSGMVAVRKLVIPDLQIQFRSGTTVTSRETHYAPLAIIIVLC